MYRGFNRGPRGRMFGHRGFRPGVFAGIIGLLFFGWIILAVIGGLLGAGIMTLGAIVHSIARIAPRLFSGLLSSKSVAVGLAIGLIWYFRTHRKNAPQAEAVCEDATAESNAAESAETESAETEMIETQMNRTFSA